MVAAVATAPPATIALRLSTSPPGVEVWLGDHRVGSSGEPLALLRGSDRVALRLKKPGFKDKLLAIIPDHDQALEEALSPLETRTRPAGKPAASQDALEKVLGGRD
jgi:hypothetical protein